MSHATTKLVFGCERRSARRRGRGVTKSFPSMRACPMAHACWRRRATSRARAMYRTFPISVAGITSCTLSCWFPRAATRLMRRWRGSAYLSVPCDGSGGASYLSVPRLRLGFCLEKAGLLQEPAPAGEDCRVRHLHRHTLARCLERPARERCSEQVACGTHDTHEKAGPEGNSSGPAAVNACMGACPKPYRPRPSFSAWAIWAASSEPRRVALKSAFIRRTADLERRRR